MEGPEVKDRSIKTAAGSTVLPQQLDELPVATELPKHRHSWNSNEEVAAILLSFSRHAEWQSDHAPIRPASGSLLLYSRKQVRYRKDGYCWKKRKDGKTTREDHMKLKVRGVECIYGCYVHSAILPTFHRRCYWLLQNPDIVLVHYLNVPYTDDNKSFVPTLIHCTEKKTWTRQELIDQIKPMYTGAVSTGKSSVTEQLTEDAVDSIVTQLMDSQQKLRSNCDCGQTNGSHSSSCRAAKCRNITPKSSVASKQGVTNVQSVVQGHLVPPISQQKSGQQNPTTANASVLISTSATSSLTNTRSLILNLSQLHNSNGVIIVSGETQTPISIIDNRKLQSHSSLLKNNNTVTHTVTRDSADRWDTGQEGLNEMEVVSSNQNRLTRQQLASDALNNCVQLKREVDTVTFSDNMKMEMQSSSSSASSHLVEQAGMNLGHHGMNMVDSLTYERVVSGKPPVRDEEQHLQMEHQLNIKNEIQNLTGCSLYNNSQPGLQKVQLFPNMVGDSSGVSSLGLCGQMSGISHGNLNSLTSDDLLQNKPTPAGLYSSLPNEANPLQTNTHNISSLANLCSANITLPDGSTKATAATSAAAKCNLLEHSLTSALPDNVTASQSHVPLHSIFSVSQSSSLNQAESMTSLTDSLEHLRSSMVSPQSADLNFDAFDILDLTDFDSEQGLTGDIGCAPRTGTVTVASSSPCLCVNSIQQSTMTTHTDHRNQARTAVSTINDYSPDWAYPEGGVKVLVTGPWYSTSSSYSVLFDSISVPGTLIQSGVLRCFCPAHIPGLVTMQVACEGVIVSNTCVFEYRSHEGQTAIDRQKAWFNVDDNALKLAVLEKLEEFEKRLAAGPNVLGLTSSLQGPKSSNRCHDAFEDRLIEYCNQLRRRNWSSGNDLIKQVSLKGMTLLHLASALGYSRLISNIIQWRVESPCLLLEYEVDALSIDDNSCTPLIWSCARGKEETAMVLYHWNPSALMIHNKDSLSPIAAARTHSYHNIANMLEKLDVVSASCVRSQPPTLLNWTPLDIDIPPPPPYPGSSSSKAKTKPDLVAEVGVPAVTSTPKQRRYLAKRLSVEVLPSLMTQETASGSQHQLTGGAIGSAIAETSQPFLVKNTGMRKEGSLRTVNSDPHLTSLNTAMTCDKNPMISMSSRDLNSPIIFVNSQTTDNSGVVAMETDSPCSDSYIDADSGEEQDGSQEISGDQMQNQMATLANQIIEAMPERIKMSPSRADDLLIIVEDEIRRERSSSHSSYSSAISPHTTEDSGISTPLAESLSFEEYRYTDLGTPASSLSPASSCLQSPYNFNLDCPPPTTAEFNEYFNAPTTFLEKDFSQLTLSDTEQRRLYVAAKIIQNFYRQYKDKQQQMVQQREREIQAAILIQSYYRRYKQYEYYKKMTQAAVLIQSQFRSYYAKKRFKRSREAATVIQNQYRTYKEHERFKKSRNAAVIIQQRFRSHYQRKRNQEMSRKMQQIARQNSHSNLWDIMHGAFRLGERTKRNRRNSSPYH